MNVWLSIPDVWFKNPVPAVFPRERLVCNLEIMANQVTTRSVGVFRPDSTAMDMKEERRRAHPMFRWVELLGLRAKNPAEDSKLESTSAIRLLAITANDRLYAMFVEIASSSGWEIRRASTVQEGLDLVRTLSLPLILLDWDENDGNWRDDLKRLSRAPNHPCVLLASRFIDDNLRQEVLRFRGYDVIAKFADREEIVRTIQFAWFWITRSQRFAGCAKHEETSH